MRTLWLAVGLALIGCGKKDEAPKGEPRSGSAAPTEPTTGGPPAELLSRAPKDNPQWKGGTIITPSAVYVDGKQVVPAAVPDELRKLAARKEPTFVLLEPGGGTAKDIVGKLRAVTAAGFPEYDILVPAAGTVSMLCEHAAIQTEKPPRAAEEVALSVTVLESTRMFVGVSRVNEFFEVSSWTALEKQLKEQKVSAFFADRQDVEIGFSDEASAVTLVDVLGAACRAGFRQMALLDPKDLSANVPL